MPTFATSLSFFHSYTFAYGDLALVTGDSQGNVNLYWVNPAKSNAKSFTLPQNTTDCATTVGTIAFATQGSDIVQWFNGKH